VPLKPAPLVNLGGRDYPLAWGNLAKVRYSGVCDAHRKLGGGVDLAIMVWACIAQKPSPFETWEDVAEHLSNDNVDAVREQLAKVFETDTPEKKSTVENGPSPVSASA